MIRNMKVSVKLIVAFALVFIVLLCCVLVAALQMNTLNQSMVMFKNGPFQMNDLAWQMEEHLLNLDRHMYRMTMLSDKTGIDESVEEATASYEKLVELENQLRSMYIGDVSDIDKLIDYTTQVGDLQTKIVRLSQIKNTGTSNVASGVLEAEYRPVAQKMESALVIVRERVNLEAENYLEASDRVYNGALMSLIIIAAVTFVITGLICLYIIKSIKKPIKELNAVAEKLANGEMNIAMSYSSKDEFGQLADTVHDMTVSISSYIEDIAKTLKRMADGDLTARIDIEFKGDFAEIAKSINNTADAFNTTLTRIHQSAEQVSTGSDQVSAGAQAMAQGATEQASAVQQLAASIQQISEQVSRNAGNAEDASKMVSCVSTEILKSNDHMKEMIKAMTDINESSSKIGKIIKTIDDIAFQTNILALNAAVEAARAGEAGKGFAVVAEEVRNLASKSAEAAKNTTALIASSVDAVENGAAIVDATAESLMGVVASTQEAMAKVQLISAASEEQATAIGQVTIGVDQISSVVQTNSATAEESAATSEELSDQARFLNELVSQFALTDADRQMRFSANEK